MNGAGITVVRGAGRVAGSRQVGQLVADSRRVGQLVAGSRQVGPLVAGSKQVGPLVAGSMPAAEDAADGMKTAATVAESKTSAAVVKASCNMPGESDPCSWIGVSVKLENNVIKFKVLFNFILFTVYPTLGNFMARKLFIALNVYVNNNFTVCKIRNC